MKLYGFFRSSAAFRVRIALNLKNISHDTEHINLQAGAQTGPEYLGVNPQGRVPALSVDGDVLLQSMAIIEYLDETHPEPAFLPPDALGRARIRAIAGIIACDIHPLNNLAVLNYLGGELGAAEDQREAWCHHWVAQGFSGIEPLLADSSDTGRFCHGDAPGLADICLVPQVFNAQRFNCDLARYPTLMRIHAACMELDAFDAAQPARQPEAADFS